MKLTDIRPGDVLIADAGFTCMRDQSEHEVFKDNGGHLYIRCSEGAHYLNGQLNDDGTLSGLKKKE
jgi:hypothetical protein